MKYQRKDAHYQRARSEGYRARSAYKLIELDRRFHLMRPGDHVVDLGCWPGAWLQVAGERVGSAGRVVGIDLEHVDPLPASNVTVLEGDARDMAVIRAARTALGRAADVVLCDLAPKLTGIADTDEARMEQLATATFAALPELLRPGGQLLMKVFMGRGQPALTRELRRRFEQVSLTKTDATRRGSSELYAAATGFAVEVRRDD